MKSTAAQWGQHVARAHRTGEEQSIPAAVIIDVNEQIERVTEISREIEAARAELQQFIQATESMKKIADKLEGITNGKA